MRTLLGLVAAIAAPLLALASTAGAPGTTPAPADAALLQDGPRQDRDGPEVEMAVYQLVLLRPGADREARTEGLSEAALAELQKGHLAHIRKMAATGKLVLAGPLVDRPDDDPVNGIFVFQDVDADGVRALTREDPLVSRGLLELDIRRWYCAEGITFPGREAYLSDEARAALRARSKGEGRR